MNKLKKIVRNFLAAANAVTVIVMLSVGFSYKLNPQEHPIFANIGLVYPLLLAANAAFLVIFLMTWKRFALISIAGFAASYIPTRIYSPLNIWKPTPDDAIKVMSYNVFLFNESDSDGLRKISEYVNASGAKIVCMQEALFNDEVRTAFSKEYQYIDTVRNLTSGEVQLVASKYPILSKQRINADMEGCLCGAYEMLIDGVRTTVLNCHFEGSGLTFEDRNDFKEMVSGKIKDMAMRTESKRMIIRLGDAARKRVPQIKGIINYIDSRKCEPVILFADFNDSPISYCRYLMAQRLTDCYTATANGPGISYHYNNIFVRIDDVLCSDHWEPYSFSVDRSISVSDHYPVSGYIKKTSQEYKKTQQLQSK